MDYQVLTRMMEATQRLLFFETQYSQVHLAQKVTSNMCVLHSTR